MGFLENDKHGYSLHFFIYKTEKDIDTIKAPLTIHLYDYS